MIMNWLRAVFLCSTLSFSFYELEKVYLLLFRIKLNVRELSVWKWNGLGGVVNVQHLCKLVFLLSFQKVSIIFFFDISFNLSFREGSRKFQLHLLCLARATWYFPHSLWPFCPDLSYNCHKLTHVMKHNPLYIKVLSNSIKLTWQDCMAKVNIFLCLTVLTPGCLTSATFWFICEVLQYIAN